MPAGFEHPSEAPLKIHRLDLRPGDLGMIGAHVDTSKIVEAATELSKHGFEAREVDDLRLPRKARELGHAAASGEVTIQPDDIPVVEAAKGIDLLSPVETHHYFDR